MEYKNGVILIMQPGWYTFTASTRGHPAHDHIAHHIRVENRSVSYARATGWDMTTVTYTGYFNQFDLEWIRFGRFISNKFLPKIKRFLPPSYLSNETIQI